MLSKMIFFNFSILPPKYHKNVENYQNIQKYFDLFSTGKINVDTYNGSKFAAMVFRTWGQLFESPNIGFIFDI